MNAKIKELYLGMNEKELKKQYHYLENLMFNDNELDNICYGAIAEQLKFISGLLNSNKLVGSNDCSSVVQLPKKYKKFVKCFEFSGDNEIKYLVILKDYYYTPDGFNTFPCASVKEFKEHCDVNYFVFKL